MQRVRVVVAPDSFGGTLTATTAAAAVAQGWRRAAPGDELVLLPLADGGPGFVDVLRTALGGEWHELAVTGPLGTPVVARWLGVGETAYVECAAACGLHLVPAERRDPATARTVTSRGVGELVADARLRGATEIVVGLGGSATTDGGAGMLAALGAVAVDGNGTPVPSGSPARADRLAGLPALDGVWLVLAADVDNPLLGRHGAAAVFAPQKGADPTAVGELDAALTRFADVLATAFGHDVRDDAGAGAAGGLGAALLACGARRVSGAGLVRSLVGLDAELDRAVADGAGGLEASLADPAGTLSALAERVASRWSRR